MFLAICLLLGTPLPAGAQDSTIPELEPHVVHLRGKADFPLYLPKEFSISPAAEGLKRVRFMAKAPDGRIFATAMHDLSDNRKGSVLILDGFDEKTGRFAHVSPYLTNLRNPNSIAFYRDPSGQNWFYLALTDRLVRYKFTAGEVMPTSPPEILASYPAYGLSYKYGGWHLTRTIAFGQGDDKDHLYVTVGSSCNACEEKEEIRATLSVMDADGKNPRILAKGLRNAVGLRFVGDVLYLTNMGADHLGDDLPDDPMFAITAAVVKSGKVLDYGWPHCYYSAGKAKLDLQFSDGTSKSSCPSSPPAFAGFAAHSSPLGFDYFGGDFVQAELQNQFLVALHGASKKVLNHGYRVVRVDNAGRVQDFITGFLDHGTVKGRPCDILRLDDRSFLLSDDAAGVIYYLRAK